MNKKKFIAAVVAIGLLTLCLFANADITTSLKLSDTNGDGNITTADALEVLQYSVGKIDKFSAEKETESGVGGGFGGGDNVHPSTIEEYEYPWIDFYTIEDMRNWLNSEEAHTEYSGIFSKGINAAKAKGSVLIPYIEGVPSSFTFSVYRGWERHYFSTVIKGENYRLVAKIEEQPDIELSEGTSSKHYENEEQSSGSSEPYENNGQSSWSSELDFLISKPDYSDFFRETKQVTITIGGKTITAYEVKTYIDNKLDTIDVKYDEGGYRYTFTKNAATFDYSLLEKVNFEELF